MAHPPLPPVTTALEQADPLPGVALPAAVLRGPADRVAKSLLGHLLVHQTPQGVVAGRIIETEAYDQADPASHSCRGVTPRTQPMFGPGGHAYIYRSYGIHLCMNVTCGPVGHGAAVLIRALEPLHGLALMALFRGKIEAWKASPGALSVVRTLCRGPGNLTQALGLALTQSGCNIVGAQSPLRLLAGTQVPAKHRAASGRIGLSVAQEVPWRFYERGNPLVSATRRA